MKKRPIADDETTIDDEETHPSNKVIDSDIGEIHSDTKVLTSHSKETHFGSKETHSDDEEIDPHFKQFNRDTKFIQRRKVLNCLYSDN